MEENPFTFEYFKKEVAFYGSIPPTKIGDIEYDLTQLGGILRDYFNENYYITDFKIPRLKIKGETWMSITPMEIQSMFIPIHAAEYEVHTAGLGLGYFALKAAAKQEVDSVVVYETHPTIIELFKQNFSDRPEFGKIEIRQADFLKALRSDGIDQDAYIFSDIYQALNSSEALEHFKEFAPEYPGYRFWGQERLLLDAIYSYEMVPFTYPMYRSFFSKWLHTSVGEAVGDASLNHVELSQMYKHPIWTEDDCEEFIEAFGAQ